MIRSLYVKHQYFFNLLFLNLLIAVVRGSQWLSVQPDNLSFILKYNAIDFVIIQVMCVVMIGVFSSKINQRFFLVKVFTFISFSILSPILLLIIANYIKAHIWEEGILHEVNVKVIVEFVYFLIIYFVLLGGVYYLTQNRINFIQQREDTLRMESLSKDARLKMLRYQINPHFLFNILNSLHALVDVNKTTAKKLIVGLSEYYRSALEDNACKHTIDEEVKIVKKYFEIQKIRFEENLEYEIELDEKVKSIHIPAFVLILLVENAVKYGARHKNGKLIVKLRIHALEDSLVITVLNSGKIIKPNHPFVKEVGTGSGIDNIKSRLRLFFENDVDFSLLEINDGWVSAKITIYLSST